MSAQGVYTLLDTHQDVLWQAGESDDSSGYWGVPPWIKHKLPPPQAYFPWPMKEIHAWPCGYFTQEIASGFEAIYKYVTI